MLWRARKLVHSGLGTRRVRSRHWCSVAMVCAMASVALAGVPADGASAAAASLQLAGRGGLRGLRGGPVGSPVSKAPAAFSCRDTTTKAGTSFKVTASLDGTTATVSGETSGTFEELGVRAHLEIAIGAKHWLLGGIPPKGAGVTVVPGTTSQGDELCVLRFTGRAQLDVLVQYFTGGAHCCFVPVMYSYSAGRYTATASLTGMPPDKAIAGPIFDPNSGLGPRIIDGSLLLASNDGRFDYEFACYACGGGPISLLSYTSGHFATVTRRYPAEIRANRAQWWGGVMAILKQKQEGAYHVPNILGALAPWVADSCLLGEQASAWKAVDAFELKGALDPGSLSAFDGQGATYVRNLHAFLSRLGYCK